MSTLHTTRAVVLRTFKHGDNSLIAKTYTEVFGARSYLVRTGKRSTTKPAHLQPMARVELVVTESREHDMHAIREVRLEKPFSGVAADHVRGLLLLFAQEVFYRTLKEEAPDANLYAFVLRCLERIDSGDKLSHLPLILLVELSKHLGFMPEEPLPGESRFDMQEGRFFSGEPPHGFCMGTQDSEAFAELLRAGAHGGEPQLNPTARRELLDQLLVYFRMHVEGFGQLRSPGVLHAVLN